jgi:hypothetical protein
MSRVVNRMHDNIRTKKYGINALQIMSNSGVRERH